jgi:hypothetical protein
LRAGGRRFDPGWLHFAECRHDDVLNFSYAVAGSAGFDISVDGGAPLVDRFSGPNCSTPVTGSLVIKLRAGSNSVRLFNPKAAAPELAGLTVQSLGAGAGA